MNSLKPPIKQGTQVSSKNKSEQLIEANKTAANELLKKMLAMCPAQVSTVTTTKDIYL
jgi:uncharacterized protein (UPF0333 family)